MTLGAPALRSLPTMLTAAEVADLQQVAPFQVLQDGELALFQARFASEGVYLQVAAALRRLRERSPYVRVAKAS